MAARGEGLGSAIVNRSEITIKIFEGLLRRGCQGEENGGSQQLRRGKSRGVERETREGCNTQ